MLFTWKNFFRQGTFVLLLSGTTAFAALEPMNGRLIPGAWATAWTTSLLADLSATTLLSHDEPQIESLCAGYKSDNNIRAIFWQQLMISLSWKESLYGPGNWIDFNGGINEGLFQINPLLRTAYGCGPIDLYDATDNIACAVNMAADLVSKYGTFLSGTVGGMAAYWQPLRSDSKYNLQSRTFILNDVTTACKSGKLVIHTDGATVMVPNTLEELGLE